MTQLLRFGDDGSREADVAWLWINNHTWPDWRLEVVRAVAPSCQAPPMRVAFSEARFGGTRTVTSDGDARLALSAPADVLVVGQRRAGVTAALHLGSTTEWLLVRPPAPMVIARHGRRTESALVCTDGSAGAGAAVLALAAAPWVGQTEVTVVAVDDGQCRAEEAIDRASTVLRSAGAVVHQRLLAGDPHDILVDLVRETRHDLLVAGTLGLTGVQRLRVGSTAARLAHTTAASVLLACDRRDTADALQGTEQ